MARTNSANLSQHPESQPSPSPQEAQPSPSALERDLRELTAAKKRAVEDEDYDRAKVLKAEIQELKARAAEWSVHEARISELETAKLVAVEAEDYDTAKRLQIEIRELKHAESRGEARCLELGHGLGSLLWIAPRPPAVEALHESTARPLPIILLDRSPSMGGTARWAVNVAVPAALLDMGYNAADRVELVTFDSETERVRLHHQPHLTVQALQNAEITCRGHSTLLAPAVRALGSLLERPAQPSIVLVISDGHVFDLPLVRSRVETAVQECVNGKHASFALFRFFNGEPPDTVALAGVASLGTIGTAPCVDCYPPAQWACTVCTAFNTHNATQCELCESPQPAGPLLGSEDNDQALQTFVGTATQAFAPALAGCARVSVLPEMELRRIPASGVHAPSQETVPHGGQACFFLPDNAPRAIQIDGRRVDVAVDLHDGGPEVWDRWASALDGFCEANLAQLRLWLVGGTRQQQFAEATAWFGRLAQRQFDSGEHNSTDSTHVLARATGLKRRIEQGESALSRLCALEGAAAFISELNSKQQGDFLRAASVHHADRLLARRALGGDMAYHDACRRAIKDAAGSVHVPETDQFGMPEHKYVSSYGGGTYHDILVAGSELSSISDELSAADILTVVGGLGAGFTCTALNCVDNPWEMSVTWVDTESFLSEADLWAARQSGDPLTAPSGDILSGVVPLSVAGPDAHAMYEAVFEPIGHLHLGAQLHGQLPQRAWSWMPLDPPYTRAVGAAAREAAVLKCIAQQAFGASNRPTIPEASLASTLVSQLVQRSELLVDEPSLATARELLRGEVQDSKVLPGALVGAALLDSGPEGIGACAARVLYWEELSDAASRSGECSICTPAQAADARRAVIALVAAQPVTRLAVTEEQVLERLEHKINGGQTAENSTDQPEIDAGVASCAVLTERLKEFEWVSNPEMVAGLCRIASSARSGDPTSAMRSAAAMPISTAFFGVEEKEAGADTGVVFSAVAVAMSMMGSKASSHAAALDSSDAARQELLQILVCTLHEEHAQSLNAEVSERLLQHRAEARRSRAEAIIAGNAPRSEDAQLDQLGAARPRARPSGSAAEEGGGGHLSMVVCGHVGSGKSTFAGRLLLELGAVDSRKMDKYMKEADTMGRRSSMFAFVMDREREERERGTSCVLSKGCFSVGNTLCSLLDVPGRKDALKHTMRGIAQADVGVLLVPADVPDLALARARAYCGEGGGGSQMHQELLLAAGVKRLIVLVNKMDSVQYSKAAFEAIRGEVWTLLEKSGWCQSKVRERVLVLPVSAWNGGNLVRNSTEMPWWEGQAVTVGSGAAATVSTFVEAVDLFAMNPPNRMTADPLRLAVSGAFEIGGIGTVVTGRVMSGTVKPGDEIRLAIEGSTSKVVSIETHHRPVEMARAGDIVGINLKKVSARAVRVGDVMVPVQEDSTHPVTRFTAEVMVTRQPGKIAPGYEPVVYVQTGLAKIKLETILWKQRGADQTTRVNEPAELKAGDRAVVVFSTNPTMPLVVLTGAEFQPLARLCVLDVARGDSAVPFMVGVVREVTQVQKPKRKR